MLSFPSDLWARRHFKMASSSVPNMGRRYRLKRATSPSSEQQATHIYFFGYEGPDPEVCFQQWFPSPFTDDSLDGSPSFPTSEHYMMYRKRCCRARVTRLLLRHLPVIRSGKLVSMLTM